MNPEMISSLEEELRNRFKPYTPKPEYVAKLKHRITTLPTIEVEYPKTRPEVLLAVIAAVSGLMICLVFLRRLWHR